MGVTKEKCNKVLTYIIYTSVKIKSTSSLKKEEKTVSMTHNLALQSLNWVLKFKK